MDVDVDTPGQHVLGIRVDRLAFAGESVIDADDHAVWTVQLDKAGEFDVYLDWACDNGSAGNRYVFEGARPPLRGKVAGTGGWDRYRLRKVGTLTLAATTGLTFALGSGTADTSMTLSGALAAVNAALDGLVYAEIPKPEPKPGAYAPG